MNFKETQTHRPVRDEKYIKRYIAQDMWEAKAGATSGALGEIGADRIWRRKAATATPLPAKGFSSWLDPQVR